MISNSQEVHRAMAEGSAETGGNGRATSLEAGSILPVAPQKAAEILRGESTCCERNWYVILED